MITEYMYTFIVFGKKEDDWEKKTNLDHCVRFRLIQSELYVFICVSNLFLL